MDTEDTSVDVTLKDGKTLNFNYKTSLHKAAQVIAFLSTDDIQGAKTAAAFPSVTELPTGGRNVANSPLEAVRQSGARTYPQKIAALGRFIVHRDNRETFDPKEILGLLRRMGDMPRNYTRDLSNAELLGYIQKEPNGEYFFTELAAEEVESQFSNAAPGTSSKKRRVRKAKGQKSSEKNVTKS